MSAREVLAYAITHAPPGVKGGPYEAKRGGYGDQSATLKNAAMWRGERDRGPDEEDLELARMTRDEVRWLRPDARVIRIVRADVRAREASLRALGDRVVQPSEASAVEVLRELVASLASREGLNLSDLASRARRDLARGGWVQDAEAIADNVLDFVAHTFDPGIGSPKAAWVRVLHEYGTVITRAEKAERERDEALGRAQSETEWRVRAVSERQDAEAERDDLRAKLARLTAPGEGSDGELRHHARAPRAEGRAV